MRRILIGLLAISMIAQATPQFELEAPDAESNHEILDLFWKQATILQSRTPEAWLSLAHNELLLEVLQTETEANFVGDETTYSLYGVDGGSGDLLLFQGNEDGESFSLHERANTEATKSYTSKEGISSIGDVNEDGHEDIIEFTSTGSFSFDFNTGGYQIYIAFKGDIKSVETMAKIGSFGFDFSMEEDPSNSGSIGLQSDTARAFIRVDTRLETPLFSTHVGTAEDWTYETADIYALDYQLGESRLARTGELQVEWTQDGQTYTAKEDGAAALYSFPDFTGDDIPELVIGNYGKFEETQEHTLIVSDNPQQSVNNVRSAILDGATLEVLAEGPWSDMAAVTQGPLDGSFIVHQVTANGIHHEWLGIMDAPETIMEDGWISWTGFPDINDDGEKEWMRQDLDSRMLQDGYSLSMLLYYPKSREVMTQEGTSLWSEVIGEHAGINYMVPEGSFFDVGRDLPAMFVETELDVQIRLINQEHLATLDVENLYRLFLFDGVNGGTNLLAINMEEVNETYHYNATSIDAANGKALWTRDLFTTDARVGFGFDTMDNVKGGPADELILSFAPYMSTTVYCDQNGCTESVESDATFQRVQILDGASGKLVQEFRGNPAESGIDDENLSVQQTSYGRSVEKDMPIAPLLPLLGLLAVLVLRRR